MCVHSYVHEWEGQRRMPVSLSLSTWLPLNKVSSPTLELTQLARTWKCSSCLHSLFQLTVLIHSLWGHAWLSHCFGIQTQVLMLSEQVLLPSELSPQPSASLVKVFVVDAGEWGFLWSDFWKEGRGGRLPRFGAGGLDLLERDREVTEGLLCLIFYSLCLCVWVCAAGDGTQASWLLGKLFAVYTSRSVFWYLFISSF